MFISFNTSKSKLKLLSKLLSKLKLLKIKIETFILFNFNAATFLALPPKFLPQVENVLKLLHSRKLEFLLKLVLKRAFSMTMVSVELVELVIYNLITDFKVVQSCMFKKFLQPIFG